MSNEKSQESFDIYGDQKEWLEKMARDFELPDPAKALRVLLDFAIDEGDEQEIFASRNSRCRHCG